MKNKLVLDGLVVLFIVMTGFLWASNAAHGHGHHNGDVLGRIMHKSAAGSGGRLNPIPLHEAASEHDQSSMQPKYMIY